MTPKSVIVMQQKATHYNTFNPTLKSKGEVILFQILALAGWSNPKG